MELTARSVQGLGNINIDIDMISGFPDIGFIVFLLQTDKSRT